MKIYGDRYNTQVPRTRKGNNNTGDLIRYIQYNNFEIINSIIY